MPVVDGNNPILIAVNNERRSDNFLHGDALRKKPLACAELCRPAASGSGILKALREDRLVFARMGLRPTRSEGQRHRRPGVVGWREVGMR
jgi:hypothetical protein